MCSSGGETRIIRLADAGAEINATRGERPGDELREGDKGRLHQHLAAQAVVGVPGHLARLLDVQAAEAVQHFLRAPTHVAHLRRQLASFVRDHGFGRENEPSIGPELAASLAPNYLSTRVVTIYGGSNEIQRNIIAKMVLGF